jgi:hypothetical protein
VSVPSNGQLLIGNGSGFVNSTLTAGTGIAISNGAGSITISATDGNITLDDGTAAAPSLNFTNEPTTGLFRASANVMGFAVNGVSRATMTTTGVTVTGTITPTGSVHAAAGSVGNPSLAFNADQDTGLFNIGANNLGVAIGGAKVLDVASTGLGITGAATISSTTAGSAGAGALIVAGGLSAGNNGSASWFGGPVQIANAIISQSGNNAYITGPTTAGAFLTLQSGNATGGINFRDSVGNSLAQYYQATNAWSFSTPTTFSSAVTISSTGINGLITGPSTSGAFLRLQSGNATGGIDFRDSAANNVAQYYEATDAWSFFKPTTFAGNIGFYNNAPVAKPTGVAVTAAAIHAALVTLNLIAA